MKLEKNKKLPESRRNDLQIDIKYLRLFIHLLFESFFNVTSFHLHEYWNAFWHMSQGKI